ncbi:hypothetical protein D3C87_1334600 [compost metagenome]
MTTPRFIPTVSVEEVVHAFDAIEGYGVPPEHLYLLRSSAAYGFAVTKVLSDVCAAIQESDVDPELRKSIGDVLMTPILLHPELATPESNCFMGTEYQPPVPMEDILRDNPHLQASLQKAAATIQEMQEGANHVPPELPEAR